MTSCSSALGSSDDRSYPIAVTLPGMRVAVIGVRSPIVLIVLTDSTDGIVMCSVATAA